MKTFKELQESLRIDESLEFHVRLDRLDRDKRLLDKVNDLLKKHERAGHISFEYETDKGVVYTAKSKSYIDAVRKDVETKPYYALVDFSESVELGEVTEGFLGKDGEKGRDIKNAGLFDKETAYSLAKKVNGVIHKDPKSDKYHVKHGKGSNVREESVGEASSTSPNMAKAVQGLNDLGYKLKGRDGKDVQRVEKLFRSGNKKVLQGAIRALDTDIRDQIMDILEPLGFVKDGVVEAMNEENVKKGDSVTVKNARKYDALSKPEVSGIVIGMAGSKVMVKVGSGQMNVDPKDLVKESVELDEAFKKGDSVTVKNARKYDSLSKPEVSGTVIGMIGSKVMVKVGSGQMNVDAKDLVKESVELDESTDAYAASLEKMANDKKLKGITPKDREMLIKLAAMMKGQRG